MFYSFSTKYIQIYVQPYSLETCSILCSLKAAQIYMVGPAGPHALRYRKAHKRVVHLGPGVVHLGPGGRCTAILWQFISPLDAFSCIELQIVVATDLSSILPKYSALVLAI